ncbi:MAG: hypothetical protein R2867_08145 [Caldilineaceae bacterium]
MKITAVRAVEIDVTPEPLTKPRTPSRSNTIHMARPASRYPAKVGHPE